MLKLIIKAFEELKNIKGALQLFGFVYLIIFLSMIGFAKKFTLSPENFIVNIVVVPLFLVALMFIVEKVFKFLESWNFWNKNSPKYDPKDSPALVAAKEIEKKEGKKAAYNNCLKEIENTKNLQKLKEKIEAILNSLD